MLSMYQQLELITNRVGTGAGAIGMTFFMEHHMLDNVRLDYFLWS